MDDLGSSVDSQNKNSQDDESNDSKSSFGAKFISEMPGTKEITKVTQNELSQTQRSMEHSNEFVIMKMNKIIEESSSKDEKLKNSLFIIKKLKEQLATAQAEMMAKDKIIKTMKDEFRVLEHKEKELVVARMALDQLKNENLRVKEENGLLLEKLKQSRDKADARIDKINKLTSTLTSENTELKRANSVINLREVDTLKKDLKNLKIKLKKTEKEAETNEENIRKLKETNRRLLEKLDEMSRDFQCNEFQNIVNPDTVSNRDKNETSSRFDQNPALELNRRYLYDVYACYTFRRSTNKCKKRLTSIRNYFTRNSLLHEKKSITFIGPIIRRKGTNVQASVIAATNQLRRLARLKDHQISFYKSFDYMLRELQNKVHRFENLVLFRFFENYLETYKMTIYQESMRLSDNITADIASLSFNNNR